MLGRAEAKAGTGLAPVHSLAADAMRTARSRWTTFWRAHQHHLRKSVRKRLAMPATVIRSTQSRSSALLKGQASAISKLEQPIHFRKRRRCIDALGCCVVRAVGQRWSALAGSRSSSGSSRGLRTAQRRGVRRAEFPTVCNRSAGESRARNSPGSNIRSHQSRE